MLDFRLIMSKRQQQREEQRSRILDAARKLFADRGPENVTMADVAIASGVARATVFNHFGTKHALVEGVIEGILAHYSRLLDEALEDRTTPTPEIMRDLFEFMGAGIEGQRTFFRAAFREISKLSVGLDEGGPSYIAREDALERLVKLIMRGQARGDLSRAHLPEDLAFAFNGLVFNTITHWLYGDDSEPLSGVMRRAADIFLMPIEAAPQPGTTDTAGSPSNSKEAVS